MMKRGVMFAAPCVIFRRSGIIIWHCKQPCMIRNYIFHSQAQVKRSGVKDAFLSDFEKGDRLSPSPANGFPRCHRPNGCGSCLECWGLNFRPVTSPCVSSDPLPFAQATHAQIRELQAALGAEHGLAEGSTLGNATGPGLGVKDFYRYYMS